MAAAWPRSVEAPRNIAVASLIRHRNIEQHCAVRLDSFRKISQERLHPDGIKDPSMSSVFAAEAVSSPQLSNQRVYCTAVRTVCASRRCNGPTANPSPRCAATTAAIAVDKRAALLCSGRHTGRSGPRTLYNIHTQVMTDKPGCPTLRAMLKLRLYSLREIHSADELRAERKVRTTPSQSTRRLKHALPLAAWHHQLTRV